MNKNDKKMLTKRGPRTAAVTLTCPPDSYADAMRTAREKIDLKEIGISALRPKRAVTGAIVLEIPGPDGENKATILRDKMEEALAGMQGVRVAKPTKMAEIRIKNILDISSPQEVTEAVSLLGGCKTEDIKVGEIRTTPNGSGTIWVRCPLKAANKIATEGRIRIGWTEHGVEMLAARQLHCYRCLERGHVQANCSNSTDRSTCCYRCSQEGHTARNCSNKPFCVICEQQGRPSSHRMGGEACKAPVKKGNANRSNNNNSGRDTTNREGTMEVETEDSRPAVRGGPQLTKGVPVPVRPRKGGKPRSVVRSGPPQESDEGAPAPVRPEEERNFQSAASGGLPNEGNEGIPEPVLPEEVEEMEVELTPALAQPPLEKRTPRKERGLEEPKGEAPSLQ